MAYIVSSGELEIGIILEKDSLTVLDSGIVMTTTVNSQGKMFVSSGGTANNTTVTSDGFLVLSSGGTANNLVISKGGLFRFIVAPDTSMQGSYNGNALEMKDASITGCSIASGCSIIVSSGGTVIDPTVERGGNLIVFSGGTATGAFVKTLGRLDIERGGTATNIVFDDQYTGRFVISNGAVIHGITVNSGMEIYVADATASAMAGTMTDIIENGGCVSYNKYATVSFASHSFCGLELSQAPATVHSGTTAFRTTIVNKARMDVYDGGKAIETTVNKDGALVVLSGGTADSTTVNSGGSLCISDGAIVNNTIINAGVFSSQDRGVVLNNTIVNSLGHLNILAEAVANGVTVNVGGSLSVAESGTATNIVENGGYVSFSNDAKVSFASNTISELILSQTSATVHSGTTANKVLIDAGSMFVSSGGIVNNLELKASSSLSQRVYAELYLSGGTANNAVVSEYCSVYVSSSGIIDNAAIHSYGHVDVSSGGTALNTTINGGHLHVFFGGSANGVLFQSNCPSIGVIYGADGSHCGLTIDYGAVVNNTVVNCNANILINGATVNGIQLNNPDRIPNAPVLSAIYNNTLVNHAEINYRCSFGLAYGATANYTTINGGIVTVSTGCVMNDVVQNGGLFQIKTATVNNATINSGTVEVSSGSMNNVQLNCGMLIVSGGTVKGIVENGGFVDVKNGRYSLSFVSNTFSNRQLIKDYATVHSGTTANYTSIFSSGWLLITGGEANYTTIYSTGLGGETAGYPFGVDIYRGSLNYTTLSSGGRLCLCDDGVVNGITVKAGGILCFSGGRGKLTGQMTFESGMRVSGYGGHFLDFDISELAPEAGARVNDLSCLTCFEKIQRYLCYTLTVSDDQKSGIFTLAEGAADFKETISVVNKAGDKLGTLVVGETVKIGYDDYTLNLDESCLSVTVVSPDLTPKATAGMADKVSWEATGANGYIVEYSTDNFKHVIRMVTPASTTDMLELPAGSYQWRVKADDNSNWAIGETIVSEIESDTDTPKVVRSNEDGSSDLFFAATNGTWSDIYYAMHVGSIHDWNGTKEIVSADGKGRIQNLFFGSSDPNVLCLTDGENGDAIFVDDVYTDLPEDVEKNTARLYKIQEVRAGAGDDIVDMTSHRFEYTGDGLTIRGGDGDDVIWANRGDNKLFGDAGNDRIVGASGNDVIAGGIGNDSMHGGGGNDVFTFCDNWGMDNVEQLSTGSVTLWFTSGRLDNWDEATLTYTDGENSVVVSGVTVDKITLKFGDDGSAQFATLSSMGAFLDAISERIFEESGKGILASLK